MKEKLLITKIKNKDEKALIEFVDTYGPILKSVIFPVLSYYPELVGEVLNDCLLAIWENIESYDEKRSSFKNWCAAVSKYKAIDALRKEIKHESVNLEDIEIIPSEDIYKLDESEKILKHLNKEDQIIFKKLFIDGYSYEEISKTSGISKDTLYNRVSRGKKTLKEILQGENK